MRQETSVQDISQYSVKATEVSVSDKPKPDPEVSQKRPRRRLSAQYKLRILDEVDARTEPGHVGAILRREGLYYSNIRTWRQQRDEGVLHGLSPKKRGRKAKEVNPLAQKVAELERQNKRL
jgi:transposase-like protein